jgi:L-lactate dehydrogenase complex protein LldG
MPATQAMSVVRTIADDSLGRSEGARRVLSWRPEALGLPDAWRQLDQLGLEAVCPHLPAGRAERLQVLASLDAVEIGLTSVVGALADTGALALASGPDRPRLAWLLPPQHVALVRVDDIKPDMASLFADRARVSPEEVAHVAFVVGPSRTADIELTLTRGVHGPKAVHIVLLT